MRRLAAVAALLALAGSACVGGGTQERTVLVDYNHDEFSTIMVGYFPGKVAAAQGDTLVFKQTWTGEPHTVTGGTLVNQMMAKAAPWKAFFGSFEPLNATTKLPDPENPEGSAADFFRAVEKARDKSLVKRFFAAYDALREMGIDLPDRKNPGDASFASLSRTVDEESNKFFEDLGIPWAFGEDNVTQNGGQPCYLTRGAPPKKEDKPCPEAKQRQPVFDGKATYYNSGIIPYEGAQGNTFRVQLSTDIKPGRYFFYCAVHGPEQSTEVTVKAQGSEIPSQSDVSREARKEIAKFVDPMKKVYRDARDGEVKAEGEKLRGPFAGLSAPVFGSINEFLPKTIRAKVGRKVTWKMMGWDHTISFDVPKYLPIIQFARNGKVSLNPRLKRPAGGSPKIPEQEGMGVLKLDGGTYDGNGFFSSGLVSAEPYVEYSLRFSKPGTYKYACLLHPPMVGTVVVTR